MKNVKNTGYVKGAARHRRTENDYMGALLDAVTLDDWQEVIAATLQAAKDGDASARNWLAQYLVGKPDGKAPSPLTVVVQQWSGDDPVVNSLSKPIINRAQYPFLHESDELEDLLRTEIAVELTDKLLDESPPPED